MFTVNRAVVCPGIYQFALVRLLGLCLLAATPLLVSTAQADDAHGESEAALTLKSRELVTTFAARLKTALQGAMQSGGPVAAIDICKDIAPAIASELSRQSGASVSRTSLRVRNPANSAENWQRQVLADFERKAAAGDKVLEYARALPGPEAVRFRYMKGIPTAGLCLACHGKKLAPQVQRQLAAEYPYDRAVGYAVGDVRGAFSIVWPAEAPQLSP